MKFEDVYFSKEDRYSIGTETDSGLALRLHAGQQWTCRL
ncbi:Uncharacterised protein [Mycobacteroides abscessus subsp. massiliense]|nr:Uncharacterised protein [Mycobacteroides abscessus subsp. massiliense]SKV05212.1 Uncharacterised protein [Mycobacteroides abscessus subsp. massiliense]